MVQGHVDAKLIPYRQKEGLNYSSIKTFEDRGVGVFYKEYILGEKKDKTSDALVIGSLVDDMVITYGGDMQLFYQNFDEKYVKFDSEKGSGQAFILADVLFDVLLENTKNGKATTEFEVIFKEAFDKVQADGKYKGKTWEKGLDDFEKVAKGYFETKLTAIGKIVVDLGTLQIAENIAQQLLTDEFTAPLLKGERSNIMPKVEVEFEYLGVKCKSEIDLIEIDHEEQSVRPFDLKCTYDNEEFDYAYIKNRYYLQQALYSEALIHWMEENDLGTYDLLPFRFIVADTSLNKRRPLIYHLSSKDMANGFKGFNLRGNKYRGLIELVEEIKWHIDNDVWNCSKEALQNNGNLPIKVNYD